MSMVDTPLSDSRDSTQIPTFTAKKMFLQQNMYKAFKLG